MLQNAKRNAAKRTVAKIGADTAENEQHFAEILPSDALWRRAVEVPHSPHGQRHHLEGSRGVRHPRSLEKSFSAFSTPMFAAKCSLESSWRDLADLQPSARL